MPKAYGKAVAQVAAKLNKKPVAKPSKAKPKPEAKVAAVEKTKASTWQTDPEQLSERLSDILMEFEEVLEEDDKWTEVDPNRWTDLVVQ